MFSELNLKPVYNSDDNNIAEEFYSPVLSRAVSFDRMSGYFSAKALSLYSEGLESFSNRGYKYRLIISQEISEDDYNQIKEGYELRADISNGLASRLKDSQLTVEQEKNISNLAYLIAVGTVDIKIAFRKKGIFHDKCGIFTDEGGNIISIHGSNNETEAAIDANYESFQVVCSWNDRDGFYRAGIQKTQNSFDKFWNNEAENTVVVSAPDAILREIATHNKGRIIVEPAYLEKDVFVFDYYEGKAIFHSTSDNMRMITNDIGFKMSLSHKVSGYNEKDIIFRDGLGYLDIKKVDERLLGICRKKSLKYITTQRYKNYIEQKDLFIDKRSELGLALKKCDPRYDGLYDDFCKIVARNVVRPLKENQKRDAFFMYLMQKAANFSVPGSGKTSSVLGVFACLEEKMLANKILVICPKNAFGSWKDEFVKCFGNLKPLRLFNIHDKSMSRQEKRRILKYGPLDYNLMLVNYESVESYEGLLAKIVDNKTLLVFDEVHKVKSTTGKQAAAALKVAKYSNYTIAMTGTPVPNSYLDLYNLLHLLFNDEYSAFFNFEKQLLSNPSESEKQVINKKIQPFFCRTTKEELGVPAANDDFLIKEQMTPEEQNLFRIVRLRYRNNPLSLAIRLLQLESNPKLLLERTSIEDFEEVLDIARTPDLIDFVDYSEDAKDLIGRIDITSKKKKCLELIKTLVSEGKKVVVWCIFKDSIRSIYDLLTDVGIKAKYVMGEVELADREAITNEFKCGYFDVLITNPHTLAESISLHDICHDAVYFEYSYNLVHLLQSKDRIHRLGLPDGQYTQYYYLQSLYGDEKSLDVNIYDRLKHKEEVMLEAIKNQELEPAFLPEDDLQLILKNLL